MVTVSHPPNSSVTASVSAPRKNYVMGAVKAVAASLTPDSELAQRRLQICRECDQWDGSRCRKCGCFTALKVRLKGEACPIGKWSKEG